MAGLDDKTSSRSKVCGTQLERFARATTFAGLLQRMRAISA